MKTRVHFLLGFQNLAVDFVKFSNAGEAFFIRCFTVTDIPKAHTEYFLVISAKPELKLGQPLVNGRIVSVNRVVRFRCQLRLSPQEIVVA